MYCHIYNAVSSLWGKITLLLLCLQCGNFLGSWTPSELERFWHWDWDMTDSAGSLLPTELVWDTPYMTFVAHDFAHCKGTEMMNIRALHILCPETLKGHWWNQMSPVSFILQHVISFISAHLFSGQPWLHNYFLLPWLNRDMTWQSWDGKMNRGNFTAWKGVWSMLKMEKISGEGTVFAW